MSNVGGCVGRSVRTALDPWVALPDVEIPEGRWLDLPLRGRTWLTELPGPPGAPTIVLLHAVGCTGLLTWFPLLHRLAERYHVVVFDQRWHGRGIISESFSLQDCADDVAAVITELGLEDPIVAGYSMGSVVAQRTWRQHPDLVGGLVLAATTDHFRTNGREMVFHTGMEVAMGALRALSKSSALRRATRSTAEVLQVPELDLAQWALEEWRSTSPWAVGQAVAALGRHHSTPWLGRIDVPTAVVIPVKDKAIPPDRQRRLAARIPGATVHEAPCGHAGCVVQSHRFVPTFLEAVRVTSARVRDRRADDRQATGAVALSRRAGRSR